MDRINTSTKAVDLFGSGKHGFKDGNLALGIPPTNFSAAWCNDIQEALLNVIETAGITPASGTHTQLTQAIQSFIASSAATGYKASVRAATTANIASLAGGAPSTLDGVSLLANDRILVKDQSTASQNGIYYVATLGTGANGTWTRATDADGAGDLTAGAILTVQEGTSNADSLWMLTTDGAITLGTTALTFARKDAEVRQIQPISASVASGALTISASALSLDFRSSILTSGAVSFVKGTPSNLVISSGSTLGTVSAVPSRIVVLALNNAGTIELAAVNIAGGVDLSETGLISTTAEGGSGAADSASVVYSTTARTNVAYRVIGYIESTQATAGTWATAPSTIQGIGGQALAAMSSLGYGQTVQVLTGSRAMGATYYNNTGKPIAVVLNGTNSAGDYTYFNVNGSRWPGTAAAGANNGTYAAAIIPPGNTYVAFANSGTTTITCWSELR